MREIGFFRCFHASQFQHIFRAFADQNVHHIIDGHDSQHAPQLIHDGHGEQVIFGEQRGDFLLVGVGLYHHKVGFHNLLDALAGVGQNHFPERTDAHQPLARVDGVEVIDGLNIGSHLTQVVEGLLDGPFGAHAHILAHHEASCGVGRVFEQFAHIAGFWGRHLAQERLGFFVF